MWKIDKQFSFCYGHRVWVQKLEAEYCARGDTHTKCRFLHGHEGLVHVFLEAEQLNPQAMVTDFKHIGWLKNFLDDYIDHKFIIDRNDPLYYSLVTQARDQALINMTKLVSSGVPNSGMFDDILMTDVVVPGTTKAVAQRFVTDNMVDGPDKEYLEGFLIVDFVPTSENLSKWLWEIVDAKMRWIGVKTSRIEWFETPKSRSTYEPDQ